MYINPLLLTDSYKLSHVFMQDALTDGKFDYSYSNFTNRGSRVDGVQHVVFFGLQAWLKELTDRFDGFFRADKETVVNEYREAVSSFVSPGFTVEHIEALHDLGYLPLDFKAVPEGTLVPVRVPSFTIENTVKGYGWLVNYLETWVSTGVWHPSTSATTAWHMRRLLDGFAEKTSDTPGAVDFQAHDFSFRGMENWQAAAQSGAGHLLSFLGSDAVPTIPYVKYNYPGDNGLIAASVPATEHSIMCLRGQDDEEETFKILMNEFPDGILSVVSDTWNLWNVIGKDGILDRNREQVLDRDGKLVIRPDSGDPVDIICGTVVATGLLPNGSPAQKGALELLWDLFGGTINSKGYMVLDSHIGLIYGDSITYDRAKMICNRLRAKGFDTTNVVFGSGSFTYQFVTRDTYASAIKATEAIVDGEPRSLQKDPITDNGTKKSAKGRLAVLADYSGNLTLVEEAIPEMEAVSLMQTVWIDGKFVNEQSFADIRGVLRANTVVLQNNGTL